MVDLTTLNDAYVETVSEVFNSSLLIDHDILALLLLST